MRSIHARAFVALMAIAASLSGAALLARTSAQAPAPENKRPEAPTAPSSSAASKDGASGNADNGRKIFVKYGCYECHGYVAQGGAGPRLAPGPMAVETFIKIVRHPPNQMPPYTQKVVTDQELKDIHAWLATLPPPPPVTSLPLLRDQ